MFMCETDQGVDGHQLFDTQHHFLREGSWPENLRNQPFGTRLLSRQLPATQQELVSLEQNRVLL